MRFSVSERLRRLYCYLFTNFSGQPIGPILKGQAVEEAEERMIGFELGSGKNFLLILLQI